MIADDIILAVFTGTGNTLVAAEYLARRLTDAGKRVRLVPMEKPGRLEAVGFEPNATLGLAVPVACFTTYPTAWRFIDALPDGGGRGVFLLATMGGMGGGMEGPVGRALARKGYRLLAAVTVTACGNYGGGVPADERREAIFARVRTRVDAFADDLLAGRRRWNRGRFNPISALTYRLGRKGTSFRFFRRLYTATVDPAACTGCRVCAELCPERAITVNDGKAEIGDACQSCQRCVGFCPVGAIGFPGKPRRPYHALALGELRAFLEGED